MFDWVTWSRVGIVVSVFGTYFMGISLEIRKQDSKNLGIIETSGTVYPSQTFIVDWKFKFGLFLIALGALLQW